MSSEHDRDTEPATGLGDLKEYLAATAFVVAHAQRSRHLSTPRMVISAALASLPIPIGSRSIRRLSKPPKRESAI